MFQLPQIGCVKLITVRPTKGGTIKKLNRSNISIESGLEEDYKTGEGGNRMVTLFQFEHIAVLSAILEKQVLFDQLRRNLFISKINLLALHNKTFKIGNDIILKGTGYCVPCKQMEQNLGPGGYFAMIGHGGITATVIGSGQITLNDKVQLLE